MLFSIWDLASYKSPMILICNSQYESSVVPQVYKDILDTYSKGNTFGHNSDIQMVEIWPKFSNSFKEYRIE